MSNLPKDHYIAEVFLKRFADTSEKVWVYDKQGFSLGPHSRFPSQICFERGGSDNPYFEEPRIVEEYLREIENRWESVVKTMLDIFGNDSIDRDAYIDAKWIISGYLAFLRFIPPAAVQAGKGFFESKLSAIYEALKAKGELPPPPVGFEFIVDAVKPVVTDDKFPKAYGIQALDKTRLAYFNAPWMVLETTPQAPFVTSDYPACIWRPNLSSGPFTFLGISPNAGLLVDLRALKSPYDHSLDGPGAAQPKFVSEVNDLVIKCAERYVISKEKSDDLLRIVEKFRNWRHRYRPISSQSGAHRGSLEHWGPVDIAAAAWR